MLSAARQHIRARPSARPSRVWNNRMKCCSCEPGNRRRFFITIPRRLPSLSRRSELNGSPYLRKRCGNLLICSSAAESLRATIPAFRTCQLVSVSFAASVLHYYYYCCYRVMRRLQLSPITWYPSRFIAEFFYIYESRQVYFDIVFHMETV